MAENRGQARLLAGGTDLIIVMRNGRRQPKLVIDAKKIPELNEISLDDNGLSIGAAVSCRQIWEQADIRREYPALVDSSSLIGGIQVQGRATLGGNLCNAAPSGDGIPTLIAYGATAHICSVDGERELPVEEVCTGPGQTAPADDEILVRLSIEKPAKNSGVRFLRFIPRNEMDIAVANVAAAVTLNDEGTHFESVRIAIGAVAPTPLYVEKAGASLTGQEINDENIAAACKIARDAASPIDDMRGTVAHRLQLVEVLTGRVIRGAIARAGGEG